MDVVLALGFELAAVFAREFHLSHIPLSHGVASRGVGWGAKYCTCCCMGLLERFRGIDKAINLVGMLRGLFGSNSTRV